MSLEDFFACRPSCLLTSTQKKYIFIEYARTERKKIQIWADTVVVALVFCRFLNKRLQRIIFNTSFAIRWAAMLTGEKEKWTEFEATNPKLKRKQRDFRFISFRFFPDDDLTSQPKTCNWFCRNYPHRNQNKTSDENIKMKSINVSCSNQTTTTTTKRFHVPLPGQ